MTFEPFIDAQSISIDDKPVTKIETLNGEIVWELIRESNLTLTASSNSIYVNDSFTLTATLLDREGNAMVDTPIKIVRGSTVYSGETDSNGQFSTSSISFANAGSYTYQAVYDGDDRYEPATTNKIVTVNKSNTSISWTSSSYTGVIGNNIGTVTVKDRSNRVVSGVTVEFYRSGTKLKTATTNSSGQCSGPSFSSTGNYTVSAKVVADSNYNASTSGNASITVNKKNSNLSWLGMPSSWSINTGDSITVSVNSDLPKGYSIKFYNNDTLLGTFTTQVTGWVYNQTITPTASGTIKAVYEGNDAYNSSTISKNITISKATPTLTLSTSVSGQSVTLNVSSNLVIGYTTLIVYVDGSYNCDMTVPSDGKTASKTITLTPSSHTIRVRYAGSTRYNQAEVSKTVTVNKLSTRITLTTSGTNTVLGELQYNNGSGWVGLGGQTIYVLNASTGEEKQVTTVSSSSGVGRFSANLTLNTGDMIYAYYSGSSLYNSSDKTITK